MSSNIVEEYHDNGNVHIRYHVNTSRKRHGLYQKWNENGRLIHQKEYINDNEHGLSQIWHENGQLSSSCEFVNGELSGTYTAWYDDGQLYGQCEFVNGFIHGLSQSWHRNGQPQLFEWWDNNVKLFEIIYTTPKGYPRKKTLIMLNSAITFEATACLNHYIEQLIIGDNRYVIKYC